MVVFAVTRRDRSRSIFSAALAAWLFLYCLGYLVEILCTTPEAAMAALRIENLGIPMIAPFFLLTALSLFQARLIKRWMPAVAVTYGFIMFLIVLFNDSHHLYYTSIEMVPYGGAYYIVLGRGPVYFLQQAVSVMFMLIAYGMLFTRFIRGSSKLRSQMTLFILGSTVGFSANILNVSGILPAGIDPTPFCMTIGLLLFSINLFRHKLMDIISAAAYTAVETMDDAMIVLDTDWGFMFCNRSAEQIFPQLTEFSGTEIITKIQDWPRALAPGASSGQVTFRHARDDDGANLSTYRANISQITGSTGKQTGWSIVIRDITDMTVLMSRLEELATTDPLTGILNRRQFLYMANRQLDMAQRHNLSMALILYDIDLFKKINDTYGHMAGDFVLCSIVDAIREQLRSYDIFARYGGEEFVIFTADGDADKLYIFAQRLCAVVENVQIVYEGTHIPVTASFGVVQIPPGAGFEAAMRAVDIAMYEAKSGGRNQVVMGRIAELPN
jgi:diguanylate cyclase (GGDEF)-like protein